MEDEIKFETNFGEKKNNSIIKVIGIGGAGNNAVQHMFKDGIVGVDFLVCNTDRMAVERNEVPSKLVFGDSGLGAGANPKEAERLALESEQSIRELIGSETRMLFITAGMGKGTGTGASPVVAKIAREMGILTIAVVTYPYELEGAKSFVKADRGIEELKKYVDSLIIIQNQKILDEYEDETLPVALGYADDVLKNAVKCIAELITLDGYQNVDFNDVLTIMKDSGEAMLGLAEASGEDRIEKVVNSALTCPLIDDTNIDNAQNFLFFVRYGEGRELKVSELKKLSKAFDGFKNSETNVIWGHAVDKDLGDKIRLSVIITNYSHKNKEAHSGDRRIVDYNDPEDKIPEIIPDIQPDPFYTPENAPADTTPNISQNTIELPTTQFNDDLFSNKESVQDAIPAIENQPSDIFTTPATQLADTNVPTIQIPQPAPIQPIVDNAPQQTIVLQNGNPASQVTMMEDPNDDIYEKQDKFDNLVNVPAFQRMQQQSPTLQRERMDQMVTPAKVVPQASYSDKLFFGVIPTVD